MADGRSAKRIVALALACWLSSTALAQQPSTAEPSAAGASSAPEADAATAQPSAVVDAGVQPQSTAPVPSIDPGAAPTNGSGSTVAAREATPTPAEAPVPQTETPDQNGSRDETDAIPGDPWGDSAGGITTGILSFRVLLQTQYGQTFAHKSDNTRPGFALREDALVRDADGWILNRFFLRAGADPTEQIGFRAIIDFAELANGGGAGAVKQAYATLRPIPKHFELHAGLFKLPFSILELDPIAKYELSSLGPADDLTKDLGFGGRDTGADVMLAPLHKAKLLRVYAGAFRGHSHEEHTSPLGAIGARIESRPVKGLRLGADVVDHPYSPTYQRAFDTSNRDVLPMPDDPLFPRAKHWASGAAYSADVTFERFRLMLRAEGMLGTRVDVDRRYGARSFWAVWGIVAYRFRAGPVRLMPALRAEWLDADREHSVGLRRALTAGVSCFFTKQLRLLVDVTRTDVEPGSPFIAQPLPLPGFPYFELSTTRVVAQLQLEI